MKTNLICIIIVLLVRVSPATGGEPYFIGIGDLPGGFDHSTATGISADARVVVGETSSEESFNDCNQLLEAFRWTLPEGMTAIGYDCWSVATAASANGSVIVGNRGGGGAFRWTPSGVSGLGYPAWGSPPSRAYSVSADGSVIVGSVRVNGNHKRAYRWTEATGFISLGTLHEGSEATDVSADGQIIVGWSDSITGRRGFRWTASTGMVQYGQAEVSAISADGTTIVGFGSSLDSTPPNTEAWLRTEDNTHIWLGDLPGGSFNSKSLDVSHDGSVVVGKGSGIGHGAFVWDAENGMQSLYDLLTINAGLDLTGWSLNDAVGVTDCGWTIVGNGNFEYSPGQERPEAWIAHLQIRSTCIRGDFTDDGNVTLDDVPDFVAVLLDTCSAADVNRCIADCNFDWAVDGRDASAFAACLLNGGCP